CAQREQAGAYDVKPDSNLQTEWTHLEFEPAILVGQGNERHHQLCTSPAGECLPPVNPPPRAGILVDLDLLPRIELEDNPVGTPEDWLDRSGLGPGLALVIRIFPRPAKRRGVATITQHRLVSPDHAIATQHTRVAQAVPN